MADKRIDQLPAATSVGDTNLFVLEQSSTAKQATALRLFNYVKSKLGLGTAATANIDTTLAVNGAVAGAKATGDAISAAKVSYFQNQAVSATTGQIMRIPASGSNSNINANTVVLECNFVNPSAISTDVTWTSYSGYIVFNGTCTSATTANVTLGQKNN